MPDDKNVLGFSNAWYRQAMATALDYSLSETVQIKLIAPVYFLATKFEAFKGRGNNDLLASRDIEDILNVLDGREPIITEIQQADRNVKNYLVEQIQWLRQHRDFDYALAALAALAGGDQGRQMRLLQRLKSINR